MLDEFERSQLPVATNFLWDMGSGSTRPAVFECSDAVDRVLKMERLCPASNLATDWIGTLLATELEVLTPAPAIVYLSEDAIRSMPEAERRLVDPGFAFGSTYIRQASTIHSLGSLSVCRNASQLISRLVPLDTWLQTEDRMRPDFGRNLLIDAEEHQPRLMAIDFGLCLSDPLGRLFGEPPEPVAVIHPAFMTMLDWVEVDRTILRIVQIPEADIVKLVHSAPLRWISDQERGKIVGHLLRTRALVGALVGKELAR